ncbi:MAG: hypothetical protein ACOVNU_05845 [Candidatus Kapaibacteriota bacterium]
MKEILEKIFEKKVENFSYNQWISVHPKQNNNGEIYETEVDSDEPSYVIKFADGSKSVIGLSELIVKIFNSK